MSVDVKRFTARACSVVLVAMAAVPLYARSVNAQGASISASVFADWNQNGTKDSGEPPLAGVTVTYTGTDSSTGSGVTDASGTVVFSSLSAPRYRITFQTPAGTFPAPLGPDNGSTVQFADLGSTVKAAFANPSDYCQSNPSLAIVCFAQDFAAGAGSLPALKTLPYSSTGSTPGGIATRLTMADVGATWGLAYHRSSKSVYQAAFFKRGVNLGSGGLDAIYSTPAASGTPVVLARIPNVGTDPRPAAPQPAGYWDRDPQGFSLVHKIGIGDIDLSWDDKTLYAVNLANNGIYSVAINADGTSGGVSGPLTVPTPADCAAAQFHVFGLGTSGVRGLVGGVCSGPTVTDLKGYVFEFTADGVASAMSATPIMSFPLNYAHGNPFKFCAGASATAGDFMAWDDVTTDFDADIRRCAAEPQDLAAPQASLTDLQITDGGDLVIGVRDRFGDQTGFGLQSMNASDATLYEGYGAGDVLMACRSGSTWTLESAGSCGGRTGSGVGVAQGPGGGEFVTGDKFGTDHEETALGSLVRVTGKGEMISSSYDPLGYYEQGTIRFGEATGASSGQTTITPTSANTSGFLGKANGLGDMEALCDQAPVEIGNRIWLDSDRDGQQGAAETGIDGVALELWQGSTKVGDAVTSNGGAYVFNATNVPGGIVANTAYEIRIVNASGGSAQAPLATLGLTTADAGLDVSDSDATLSGTTAVITVPAASIRSAGQNNHTFDAGFSPPVPPTTQAPTTQAPTTQAPTTQAPTTQAPTTQAPTTQAPTTVAASGVLTPAPTAATTVAPSTVGVTTTAAPTASTTVAPTTSKAPAPTTAPVVVTVDPAPPTVDVEGNIALTGANDDRLALLSFGLILAGIALWIIGGQPAGATRSGRRPQRVPLR